VVRPAVRVARRAVIQTRQPSAKDPAPGIYNVPVEKAPSEHQRGRQPEPRSIGSGGALRWVVTSVVVPRPPVPVGGPGLLEDEQMGVVGRGGGGGDQQLQGEATGPGAAGTHAHHGAVGQGAGRGDEGHRAALGDRDTLGCWGGGRGWVLLENNALGGRRRRQEARGQPTHTAGVSTFFDMQFYCML